MARNAGATASKSHRFLAKVPSPRHRVPSVPAFPKMRVQAATRTFTDVPCHGAPQCGHCLEPVAGSQWGGVRNSRSASPLVRLRRFPALPQPIIIR